MSKLHVVGVAVALLALFCNVQCLDVKSQTYTTTDGLVVASVAYITTFEVKGRPLTLFAELPNGRTVPVSKSGDGQRYEVSWTEEVAKARTGDQQIRVFDEEGFSQLRKAQRKVEEGGDATEVKPLFTLTVYHPGTYRGLWFNVEAVASLIVLAVYYFAYSAKSKLTA